MRAADADLDYRIRILKNAPLFKTAADDDISELARVSRVFAVERGNMLAQSGQEGTFIFVVKSGVGAELHFELGEDKPILVKLHGPGSIAGVVCAIIYDSRQKDPSGGAMPARRPEALSNMTVLRAPAADFLRVCRRNPDLSAGLIRLLAEQSDLIARVYARSTQHTLEMRLAAFFSRVCALSAVDDWNPANNVGKLSQSRIAAMLGVSRERVNKTIGMWERSGLIFQNKSGDFIIEDVNRLAQIARTRAERGTPEKEDDWLWEIDSHLDRGLNETALHLALEASKRAPKDWRYGHRAVLATARLGAISEALNLIEKWKISEANGDEEATCLRPRLLRDLAYEANPHAPDRELLSQSAQEYERIFKACGGPYSGVNAAAGFALIGEVEKSKIIATDVCSIIAESDSEYLGDYWRRTTLAECKLLCGDKTAAASLFAAASNAADATPGKKATTRKQLKRLSAHIDIDEAWIDRVTPQAGVIFYSGPLASELDEKTSAPTAALLSSLADFRAANPIAWAYGALASGADIIIAEALLDMGVSLNVFLPLPPEEFLKYSVETAGAEWRERFIGCMRRASSIEWIRCAAPACDSSYRLGAIVAMGKAIRYAAQLETNVTGFFAAPNGFDATRSLSAANAQLWRSSSQPIIEISGAWPTTADGRRDGSAVDDVVLYALAVMKASGEAASEQSVAGGKWSLQSEDGALDVFLFDSLEQALDAAATVAASPARSKNCLWLDAGAFSREELRRSPRAALARLITSACRPITEPGRIFASDLFACAAALSPAPGATFEYAGFAPTREKLNPCALHILRLR